MKILFIIKMKLLFFIDYIKIGLVWSLMFLIALLGGKQKY